MTQEQRNYMTKAIVTTLEYAIFQHEVDRLETMLAKWCNPKSDISEDELKEDLRYLELICEA